MVERRGEMIGDHQARADDRRRLVAGIGEVVVRTLIHSDERQNLSAPFARLACGPRAKPDQSHKHWSVALRTVVDRGDDLVADDPGDFGIWLVDHALADDLLDLALGEDLALDQRLGHAFQLVAMLFEQPESALVGLAEDAGDLLVDHLGSVLRMVAQLGHLAAEERVLLGGTGRTRGRRARSCPTGSPSCRASRVACLRSSAAPVLRSS